MSAPSSLADISHYEQACDQAIAMCDGNLRSTIKALIMANEYLEAELAELQAAVAAGCGAEPSRTTQQRCLTRKRSESWQTSPITSHCHFCRTTAARRSRQCGGVPERGYRVAPRRDAVAIPGSIGAIAFSRTGDPMIGEFGDAQLLRKFGNVPDDLSGL